MTASPDLHPTLESRLVGFARALRDHGVVAGPSDVVDSAAVASVLGLQDRERLRAGFAAALLRRSGERELFDDLFDVWFPAALGQRTSWPDQGEARNPAGDPASARGPAPAAPADPEERRRRAAALREDLATALARSDAARLDQLAARTVSELGRLPNDATTGSWSAQQALDALAPQTAIAAALAQRPTGNGFADGFIRDELRSAVAAFRARVARETRRRNAEGRGPERISRSAVRAPVERVPFLLSGTRDAEQMRAVITPLARRLATRIAAKQRRSRRGQLDMRRTLRRSLGTGGIPIRPAYRRPRPGRPDIVLLCDMSQSVAGFSRFTIVLMQALSRQFRRVRIFGFVNVVDELTDLVAATPPGADISELLKDTARMTRWHTNSDYGSALTDFVEHHLDGVGHRSAVLILGDARSNNTDPGLDALRTLVERARVVTWLNPEPHRQWGSGDSVAPLYHQIVDMHECSNIEQLRQFVTRLLPVT